MHFLVGNIAEFLLSEGLAKIVDWNLSMVTPDPSKYRALESKARADRKGIWLNHIFTSTLEHQYEATVVRIVGPDCLLVEPVGSINDYRKIFLSSFKPPKRTKNESGTETGYSADGNPNYLIYFSHRVSSF